MTPIKQHINSIPTELAHNGTTMRKKLITQDAHKGRLATYNYAWLESGNAIPPHIHEDGEEFYFFLEGNGSMLVGDSWFSVTAGDFITVPHKHLHSVRNDKTQNLVFMAIRTIDQTGK